MSLRGLCIPAGVLSGRGFNEVALVKYVISCRHLYDKEIEGGSMPTLVRFATVN